MKKPLLSFLVAGVLALVAAACSDREMHLDKLKAAFDSAAPEAKTQLDTAIQDVNRTNYTDALSILQKISFATKMNNEQRDILEDTIRKLRQKTPSPK